MTWIGAEVLPTIFLAGWPDNMFEAVGEFKYKKGKFRVPLAAWRTSKLGRTNREATEFLDTLKLLDWATRLSLFSSVN